jgi:hypothetical protein
MDLIKPIEDLAALAAAVGMLLLLPLFLSQRRDLMRLRAFMESAPGHPAEDLAGSEAILDRAEAELEAFQEAEARASLTPVPGVSPAQRVTGDRPALERITMEREALAPHPRWRRFTNRFTQPRTLVVVAVVAALLGVGAVLGSDVLLDVGGDREARHTAVVPGDVEVAVLNGTSIPGLAVKVGDDVKANGFKLGTVTNSSHPYQQTVVLFAQGQQRAARKVAHDLGVKPLQPVDAGTTKLAPDADVVVIAGEDRAQL